MQASLKNCYLLETNTNDLGRTLLCGWFAVVGKLLVSVRDVKYVLCINLVGKKK